MKKTVLSIFLVGMFCGFYGCKDKTAEQKSLTKEVQFKKEGELLLKKQKTDSTLAKLDIEIADDDYQTETGLMYRHSMPNNQGMLFIFPEEGSRAFYMKNTEFGLDIIFINSEKEVVSIQKNAKPYDQTSLPAQGASQYVLEVNAGLTENWDLEKGDLVDWK